MLLFARLAKRFVVYKINSTLQCGEEKLRKTTGLLTNANIDPAISWKREQRN